MSRLPEIALVTHDFGQGGGTATMSAFLHRALTESGRYRPRLISLATSSADAASVRVLNPASWRRRPLAVQRRHAGLDYRHLGAWLPEFEFQRYKPRRALAEATDGCDLIQFVVGMPAWGYAALRGRLPVVVWTATTAAADRGSRMRQAPAFHRALWTAMMPLTRRLERRVLSDAAFVLALSDYTRRAVSELGTTAERCAVAVCGVDTELFRPGRPEAHYILSVTRATDPRKNVRLLLQAYADLVRTDERCPDLYLVGAPPPPHMREELAELGVVNRVQILGPKYGEQLAALYRGALLFALSSDEEGLAIVILEAMSSGLAVVSTHCGGPATIVEHGKTGLLTPVGERPAFADAMRRLVANHSERATMGASGRQAVVARFSIPAAAAPFIDVYDRILSISPLKASERMASASVLA